MDKDNQKKNVPIGWEKKEGKKCQTGPKNKNKQYMKKIQTY